jgi:hypothetical protein
MEDPTRLPGLRREARESACRTSWDSICAAVWEIYDRVPRHEFAPASALLH